MSPEQLQSERQKIAAQIVQTRRYEAMSEREMPRDGYVLERNAYGYLNNFFGLQQFFEYLHSLPTENGQPNIVLDIGTGSGKGWSDLAESPINPGLEFRATALRASAALRQVMTGERVKVHLTSAEVLRGIEDNSLAGIVGMFSLTYSVDQGMMAENLVRKLKQGGAIKALYPEATDHIISPDPIKYPPMQLNPASEFVGRLLSLGCGVECQALAQNKMVVVAVKQSDESPQAHQQAIIKAKQLLANDASDKVFTQQEQLVFEYLRTRRHGSQDSFAQLLFGNE